MIEKFFTQTKTLGRLRSGVLGPYLSEFATALERDAYSVASIRRHPRAADRFGNWLLKQGITVPEVNPATVERYIEGLERVYSAANPQGRLPDSALGLRGADRFIDAARSRADHC